MKWNPDQDVVRPADKPLSPTGGVVGLRGNLAPDGAIVKVAGMKTLQFSGPARCFDSEEDCFAAVSERTYKDGEVLVIRYEGPRGGPGMREMLSTTAALYGQGAGEKVALITDGRFSGAHARLLHRPRRAGGGGRRADRPLRGRRHHRHRRRWPARFRSASSDAELGGAQGQVEAARDRLHAAAQSGNMRRGSVRRGTAP